MTIRKRKKRKQIGDKVGKFTIVGYSGIKKAEYTVVCECGHIQNMPLCNMKTNTIGCKKNCWVEWMANKNKELNKLKPVAIKKMILPKVKPPITPPNLLHKLFNRYKSGAKRRNVEFELTIDQFKKKVSDNCHYCGCEPSTIQKSIKDKQLFVYKYNGIDRKDNNIGYTIENSLPCCSLCNYLKGRHTYDNFISQVLKISHHISSTWNSLVKTTTNGNI